MRSAFRQRDPLRSDAHELHVSNRTTKGLRTRYLPLSQELRAMLELRRHDPDGDEFGPDAYVFGNEVGERLKNYQKAWSTLRLRAIGHGPHWGPVRQIPSLLPRAA